MPSIELSEQTLEALRKRVKDFGDSPETVIRRLLTESGGMEKSGEHSETALISPFLVKMIESREFINLNGRDRYFALLKYLHDKKPDLFAAKACGLKFGKRIQIARSKEEIENSGTSTFPEQIPGTKIWALTNLSNRSKRDVIRVVMQRLDFPQADEQFAVQAIPDRPSSLAGLI